METARAFAVASPAKVGDDLCRAKGPGMGQAETANNATTNSTAPREDDATAESLRLRSESRAERSSQSQAGEVAGLEQRLADRADQIRELQEETNRLRRLLRELGRRIEVLPTPSPDLSPEQLHAAYQAAVNRVVEAEAGRAELTFRLDEALGQLQGASGQEATDHSHEREQAELHEAHLAGSLRGLRAALADVEEARDTAQARLILMEDDLQQAKQAIAEQRRRLLEDQEEFELLRLRAAKMDEASSLLQRVEEADRFEAQSGELDAENRRLQNLLQEVRGDLLALVGERDQESDQAPRPSANLTTAVGTSEAPPHGAFTASVPPPARDADSAAARLTERLTRSEQLVRTLQGELGRERDERSEERKRAEADLVAQSAVCDSLREDVGRLKQQRVELALKARSLLGLVPAGDALASQLGDLLASLDS